MYSKVNLFSPDLRPYRCSICDTAFRRKDNLERHMKNTHPETRLTALGLLNKNYSQQLANTSNPQQHQLTVPSNGAATNNPHHPTDTLEKISNNIYKQITQPEAQIETFCTEAVPCSRNDTQNITNTQTSPSQESSCIKSISQPISLETAQKGDKLTSMSALSDFSKTMDLTTSRETTQKPKQQTRVTKGFKGVLDPVRNMNITSFKEMLDPVRDTTFTGFKEPLDPAQGMSVTKLLDPVRTTNISSFRDMLDPFHDMSIATFKEPRQGHDTSVTGLKEMLDPVQATSIFPSGSLFQQISEVKQKSQAVPVINRPITPSQQTVSYGRIGKTNLGKEKVEGTNCVPTITKTSNVLHSSVLNATNYGHENVLTTVSASNLRTFPCKKSGKVMEDNNKDSYSELASRTLQSDLHWRKRTVELLQQQQEMAQDGGFI